MKMSKNKRGLEGLRMFLEHLSLNSVVIGLDLIKCGVRDWLKKSLGQFFWLSPSLMDKSDPCKAIHDAQRRV